MADSALTLVDAAPATSKTARHSVLVRVTHWLTTLCFFALLISGMEIVISHPRFYWGESGNPMMPSLFDLPIPASRPWVKTGYDYVLPDQNGWSRNLHFEAAWIVILTGFVYVVSSLAGRHFRKNLLPERAVLARAALWTDITNHLRFRRPDESEAWSYNVLQRLTYLAVIFVLFPVAIWTGLAMSPAIQSVFPFIAAACGGQQSARTIHFFVTVLLVLFLAIHIVMVVRAGFRNRMRAMITGSINPKRGFMNSVSRRKMITTGLAATAGASGLAVAARLADRYGLVPPDHGGVYGPGTTLTYAAQRLLTSHSMAREFPTGQISKAPFAKLRPFKNEAYERLRAGGFVDWRVTVGGMVARPVSFSLAELKSFPSSTHITALTCEEGWSFVAEWTGAPLSHILQLAGTLPQARYVVYDSIQANWRQSIDMADALHPQTLLIYGMNGSDLSMGHGGPVRLRLPRQLGYKNVKYITRLTVTDSLQGFLRKSTYSWYAGI